MIADAAPDLGESALVFQMPMDEGAVGAWIDGATIGDKAVYFIGHLAVARDLEGPFARAGADRLGRVADIVLRHARAGRLELKQFRAAPGCFVYVAKRVH